MILAQPLRAETGLNERFAFRSGRSQALRRHSERVTELDASSSYGRVAARPRAAPLSRRRAATRTLAASSGWSCSATSPGSSGSGTHAGNVADVHTTGDAFTSVGRLTGLLAAYSALAPGRPPRADPVDRAARRLRPSHRLAPPERPRLPVPRARARGRDRDRLRGARPSVDPARGRLDDDRATRGWSPPGSGLPCSSLVVVSSIVIVRRRLSLRVVVRRAPARLRRDRARLVPPDPDRQRARRSTRSPPTTGARSTLPRSR